MGTRPLSGSSFPGGLGGTRMRKRKMHFFFLISLPQRNLGGGQGEEKALESVGPSSWGGQSSVKITLSASLDPELKSRVACRDADSSRPVGPGVPGGGWECGRWLVPVLPLVMYGSCCSSPFSSLPQLAPRSPPTGRPPPAPSGTAGFDTILFSGLPQETENTSRRFPPLSNMG